MCAGKWRESGRHEHTTRCQVASKLHRSGRTRTETQSFLERATFISMHLTNTIFTALCAIGVSVAASAAQDAEVAARPDAGYRLSPKDSLTIVVFGHEELS